MCEGVRDDKPLPAECQEKKEKKLIAPRGKKDSTQKKTVNLKEKC